MIKFKIKQLRQYKGISQEELARKVGLSRSYISKIENNTSNDSVTLHTFLNIMKALDVQQPWDIFEFCDYCKYKQNSIEKSEGTRE